MNYNFGTANKCSNNIWQELFGLKKICQFETAKFLTLCYIYSTVGRSIASIYDLGGIFTLALCAPVNMSSWVVYIGYGPTYRIIYTIYYGECATDEPFA